MSDLLVKLYDLDEERELFEHLEKEGIVMKRMLSPDRKLLLDFISSSFTESSYAKWPVEAETAFFNQPVSCYAAVKDKKIIGFACYDATANNFFGPTGVLSEYRGKNIGKALLIKCLLAMKEDGYAYAVIGWVEDHVIPFYQKSVHAIKIENSHPGVYSRMIEL